MVDSPLCKMGAILGALPSSQSEVERVFSAAGWQATDRERLSQSSLAQEVCYVRNSLASIFSPEGQDPVQCKAARLEAVSSELRSQKDPGLLRCLSPALCLRLGGKRGILCDCPQE